MPGKRFSLVDILKLIRHVEVMDDKGKTAGEICKGLDFAGKVIPTGDDCDLKINQAIGRKKQGRHVRSRWWGIHSNLVRPHSS